MSDDVAPPRSGRRAAVIALVSCALILAVFGAFWALNDRVRSAEFYEAHSLVGPFVLTLAIALALSVVAVVFAIRAVVQSCPMALRVVTIVVVAVVVGTQLFVTFGSYLIGFFVPQ